MHRISMFNTSLSISLIMDRPILPTNICSCQSPINLGRIIYHKIRFSKYLEKTSLWHVLRCNWRWWVLFLFSPMVVFPCNIGRLIPRLTDLLGAKNVCILRKQKFKVRIRIFYPWFLFLGQHSFFKTFFLFFIYNLTFILIFWVLIKIK